MKYYESFVALGVFSKSQAIEVVGTENRAKAILQSYQKKGYIERIRKNLYVAISLETKQPIASRYRIGTALFPDACISHHSAFEFFGYANQVYYEVYVATESRFADFEYNGVLYHRVDRKKNTVTTSVNGVVSTTLEQTVVDSIRDFEKLTGIEEVLRCIQLIPSLNASALLDILKNNGNQFLFQKCGYILSAFNGTLRLPADFFDECRTHLPEVRRYLMKDEGCRFWDKDWELYTPQSVHSLVDKGDMPDAEV